MSSFVKVYILNKCLLNQDLHFYRNSVILLGESEIDDSMLQTSLHHIVLNFKLK